MTEKVRKRICIGIPCYQNAPAETLEDYMRFAYHCGRRMTDYDFYLAIKPKFEQFRARNAIFQAACQVNCDFLLMLDDDHVIGWTESQGPNDQYDMLYKLLKHMENDEKLGVVGALYYHRGGECLPVIMKEGTDGGYYYMRDDEIKGEFQEVAVTGGGCMLLRMDALLRCDQPIFGPEFKYGTDIQVCSKLHDAGYRVACDTSIVVGHVMTKREVVTPENRPRIAIESISGGSNDAPQFDPKWGSQTSYNLYWMDGLEYLGVRSAEEINRMADEYAEKAFYEFPTGINDQGVLNNYYIARGKLQLARQMMFHGTPTGINNDQTVLSMFRGGDRLYGLDYACGSSPVGFELAMRGHQVDFVDLPGAGGLAFVRWRAKRRDIERRCGWELKGPYQFILLMDALEHFIDPCAEIEKLSKLLIDNGIIITNYFSLTDDKNVEHISMDRDAVKQTLVNSGIYPLNPAVWIKRDLGFMDVQQSSAA
jgi:hypothetical protein